MKDNKDRIAPGKFVLGAEGVGTIDEALVEKRAMELARIEAREDYNEKDLSEARAQLTVLNNPPLAPELIAPDVENMVAWDEAPSSDGQRAVTREFDNEDSIGELLVREGIEEADHNRRLAASDAFEKEV